MTLAAAGDQAALSQEGAPDQATDQDRSALPDDDDLREAYRRHARPRTAEVLRAVGLDVVFHRAKGDHLFFRGDAGREVRVLDLLGGFGATLFGHNHPELVAALAEALGGALPVHAQASTRSQAALLAERLSAHAQAAAGGDRSYVVTLSNSGAEAVEAAIKHAEMEERARTAALVEEQLRRLARARIDLGEGRLPLDAGGAFGATAAEAAARLDAIEAGVLAAAQQPAVAIGVVGGFHGKTLGALQLTYNPMYRAIWERQGAVVFVAPDDADALAAALAARSHEIPTIDLQHDGRLQVVPRRRVAVTGVFIEPIQGEGGVRPLSRPFLERARRLCDDTGVPLIFDEIQSGMGRTGRFFASEAAGVAGDYYILSKSLGGALVKLGATLVAADRYQTDFGYLHTSTFAEDDLSCLVARRSLELLERGDGALLRECAGKGEYLLGRLRALQARHPSIVADVRGRGLMVGIELAPQIGSSSALVRILSEQNLLGFVAAACLFHEDRIRVAPALSAQGTIRLEPSAFIPRAEIDRFVDAFDRFCRRLHEGDVTSLLGFAIGAAPARVAEPVPVRPPAPVATVGAAEPAPGAAGARSRVAFLVHFRGGRDLQLLDAAFRRQDAAACQALLERVTPIMRPFRLATTQVRSPAGSVVAVDVIGVPFTAAQASAALHGCATGPLVASLRAAVSLAHELGASVVGCGGYTSILTDNCRDLVRDDIAVTSGNSLTVAATVEALDRAAQEIGVRRRVLGIVGAAGNIGATLAEAASGSVDSVVLVGRPRTLPRLQRVAARLAVPVRVATDLEALTECSMIVSASNAPTPIIRAEHINHEPLVLSDVAVPRDVDPGVLAARPNARVIRGGLVRLPLGQTTGVPALDLPDGRVYACLGEAILLGLAGVRESFSFGPLRTERVQRIRKLAREHGFEVDVEEWDVSTSG